MREWFERFFRRIVPPVPQRPGQLAKPLEPVKLHRVFPPLPASDAHLAREHDHYEIDEDDIARALEGLRGGQNRKAKTRITRPARFHIALRQLKGFCQDCLMVQAGSTVSVQDMYAGYLLWAANSGEPPISNSDFDFAMADYLASVGGLRTERGYQGCRFRQDFVRRLDNVNSKEAKRRLGMGLEELMAGKRPGSEA